MYDNFYILSKSINQLDTHISTVARDKSKTMIKLSGKLLSFEAYH